MLHIDGTLGGGGSQTLRTALCLAALTRRDAEVVDVRASRRAPGLRFEQLAEARAIAEVSRGRLEGDTTGSTTLRFSPGRAASGRYEVSLADPHGEAGPVGPILQALVPILMSAPGASELVVRGATHGPEAPTATYLQTVFQPTARKFGFRGEVVTEKWGWAPHGVGAVRVSVEPGSARACDLTQRGEMLQLGGLSVASRMDAGFADRLKNRAARRLAEVGRSAQIQTQTLGGDSTGAMLLLLAVYERAIAGFSSACVDATPAEQVADAAVDELFEYQRSYMVLDKHLAEQILVIAAIADGTTTFSTSEWTPRADATAALIRQFHSAKVSVDGGVGEPSEVTIEGVSPRR